MKDRVPLYPGRVKLTPVAGQANTYDMSRADSPQQEGTPLNKESLLTDATAAAFGLGADATPNDVLNILKAGVLHGTTGEYIKCNTIGDLPVGETVSLNVNGEAREFLVVHQGKPSDIYDDSCDGTWLLMKDIYEKRAWHNSQINKYESSAIHSYLNNTFINLFDTNIRNAIKQVKIPYRKNGGSGGSNQSGANGLSCKVFLLSGYEVGWTNSYNSYIPVDGAKLDYFGINAAGNSKRIAKYGSLATYWWLRSPVTGGEFNEWYVNTSGGLGNDFVDNSYGIRPALVLPSTFDLGFDFYKDNMGNLYPEQKYITILSDVFGNVLSVGPKIAVGSYVGTGTYGEANQNSLTFDFEPKFLVVYAPYDFGSDSSESSPLLLIRGFNGISGTPSSTWGRNTAVWNGHTVKWYGADGSYQHNMSSKTYCYFAIG